MEENAGNAIVEKICKIRSEFEKLRGRHSDDSAFEDCVNAVLEENGLPSDEKIRADYAKKVDSNRLLKIGIVGAVKAGKSSLLNALFFDGSDILPKAATPMTAALTELTYGEQYSVTVDFFTEGDIEELRKKAAEYKRRFEECKSQTQKDKEDTWRKVHKRQNPDFSGEPEASDRRKWEDMACQTATTKLRSEIRLSGAYEQYQKIEEASVERKTESENFTVNSIDEIAGRLEEYVGSSGRYMPFTSKVSIALPLESLKGIAVIDTPGFNDPVPSRDDRARQALRECDVIFILSKATPFLPRTDMDVIAKITKKNGIRELYIIPSQVDGSLIAPERIKGSGADLDVAIRQIVEILCKDTSKNLRTINESGAFDQLIQNPEMQMFVTSGQCESMARTFADRANWDQGKQQTWANLRKHYPDYFSDGDQETSIASLRKLGNIEKIRSAIDAVKERKAVIFKESLSDFGKKYEEAAKEARAAILRYLDEREHELEKRDIGQIEEKMRRLQHLYEDIAPELDDAFIETLNDWYTTTKDEIERGLSFDRDKVKGALKSNEGEGTGSYTTGHLWWKETHSYTYTTVNANAVTNSIADYIDDYNKELPHFLETKIQALNRKVRSKVCEVWSQQPVADTDSGSGPRNRVYAIMMELTSKEYELEYTGNGFSYDCYSPSLTGASAEECISQANNFVSCLNRTFRDMLYSAMKDVYERCRDYAFSKNVLDAYCQRLEKMKEELEKPKLAVENLRRMRKEAEAIGC